MAEQYSIKNMKSEIMMTPDFFFLYNITIQAILCLHMHFSITFFPRSEMDAVRILIVITPNLYIAFSSMNIQMTKNFQ